MQYTSTQQMRTAPSLRRNAPHYATLRWALKFGARISTGLAIGTTHGFNSGCMADYIYENEANGTSFFGELIDRIYLNQSINRALRARATLLKDQLRSIIQERAERGASTRILDLASGVGRIHVELLQEETCQDVSVTCVDNDSVALEEGQYVAEQAGVESQITYVYGNAFQLVDAFNNALLEEVPDVVVVSGLYESIADDAVVCQSLLQIHTLLRPNGNLLVTTQPSHPRQEIVANVLSNQRGEPWVIATRPLSRMKRWMREAGFHTLTSDEEPEGLCGVVWGLA